MATFYSYNPTTGQLDAIDRLKISTLPAVSALSGTDVLPIVNEGKTRKVTVDQLTNFCLSSIRALSANWQSTYVTVCSLSSNWESTYSTVSSLSSNWESTYVTVCSLSAEWVLKTQPITEITSSYVLQLSDSGRLILADSTSSNITISAAVPGFKVGQKVDILQTGANPVDCAEAFGATLNGTPSLVLRDQWSAASFIHIKPNQWVVIGDLA